VIPDGPAPVHGFGSFQKSGRSTEVSGFLTPDAAAQCDLNVAQYLTEEKGIDPARIEMSTGGQLNRSLDNILVPTGASFIPGDTNTFDSNSVKHRGSLTQNPKSAARVYESADQVNGLCTTHEKESLGLPFPFFCFPQ
jgi:hypothetical protein